MQWRLRDILTPNTYLSSFAPYRTTHVFAIHALQRLNIISKLLIKDWIYIQFRFGKETSHYSAVSRLLILTK